MNNSTINKVSSILGGLNVTPFKNINLNMIPEIILVEFLLYNQNDIPQYIKNSYFINLIEYGFIQQSNNSFLNPIKNDKIYKKKIYNKPCNSCSENI